MEETRRDAMRFLPSTFVLSLLLCFPGVLGQASSPSHHDGSELDPNLVDPVGDVEWAVNTDGTSHEYVDLLAVWINHSTEDDVVSVVWKTSSNEGLSAPPPDWAANCWLQADVTLGGTSTGFFRFEWNTTNGAVHGRLMFMEDAGGGVFNFKPMNHSFAFEPTKPGRFEWKAPRQELLWRAESIDRLRAYCFEAYAVVDALASVQGGSLPWQSAEYGNSTKGFDFMGLEIPDDKSDPAPDRASPAEVGGEAPSDADATSASAAIVGTLLVVACLRARRRG